MLRDKSSLILHKTLKETRNKEIPNYRFIKRKIPKKSCHSIKSFFFQQSTTKDKGKFPPNYTQGHCANYSRYSTETTNSDYDKLFPKNTENFLPTMKRDERDEEEVKVDEAFKQHTNSKHNI